MARLSLSRSRVYRLVKDGVLKASKNDAVLTFQEDDVAAAAVELAGRRQRAETLVRIFTTRLAEHGIVDLPEVGIADDEAGSKEAVRRLLLDCMAAQASDFYVNPTASGDKLLVRTLGRIHEVARVEGELGDRLKAELKALASLPDGGSGVSCEAIFRQRRRGSFGTGTTERRAKSCRRTAPPPILPCRRGADPGGDWLYSRAV